jgi:hypothetical protein
MRWLLRRLLLDSSLIGLLGRRSARSPCNRRRRRRSGRLGGWRLLGSRLCGEHRTSRRCRRSLDRTWLRGWIGGDRRGTLGWAGEQSPADQGQRRDRQDDSKHACPDASLQGAQLSFGYRDGFIQAIIFSTFFPSASHDSSLQSSRLRSSFSVYRSGRAVVKNFGRSAIYATITRPVPRVSLGVSAH